jgi:endonuclease YncB( thermonuclease family)
VEADVIEPVQVFWAPAGASMPSLGARALVDVTDGDTPNLRMPVRMLSVDTPEVTARTADRAAEIDREFTQLAEWIRQGRAPIGPRLAESVLPKLESGRAGSLHFEQGQAASAFGKQNITERLARRSGRPRGVFIRVADTPFDNNHRLLAYVAPDYSEKERREIPKAQRPTFNLDLVAAGWAAPFVISVDPRRGRPQPADRRRAGGPFGRVGDLGGPGHAVGVRVPGDGEAVRHHPHPRQRRPVEGGCPVVRERYCVDMRTRVLHGPEDYVAVDPEYRLWIWPQDLNDAVARLNLSPAPALVGAG